MLATDDNPPFPISECLPLAADVIQREQFGSTENDYRPARYEMTYAEAILIATKPLITYQAICFQSRDLFFCWRFSRFLRGTGTFHLLSGKLPTI